MLILNASHHCWVPSEVTQERRWCLHGNRLRIYDYDCS